MNCPSCHQDVSKAFNQFGMVKTCDFCRAQFKIKIKFKETILYVLAIAVLGGTVSLMFNDYVALLVLVGSFPFAMKWIYRLEIVNKPIN